tara:strand:+ start:32 stop:703 length:672 start_codon:yes stop_codon:yes gene_type:complete
MIINEINKRISTSIFLLIILFLTFEYSYFLIITIITIGIISWIEFYSLISKIFTLEETKHKIFRFLSKSLSLLFVMFLVFFIISITTYEKNLVIFIVYSLFVAIASDIGGLTFGKIFKGKKLTKISPKKTISGSIGSFIFSLILIPFFLNNFMSYSLISVIIITMLISLISQLGDLSISYLKRKAKVKNTSNLLPGHGGLLDRIDGIIFAIPFGFVLFNFFRI